MSQERLSLALTAELKARVKAEADERGVKIGIHARDIIGQHFEGQSGSRVDEQLAELTEAIDRLRSEGRGMGIVVKAGTLTPLGVVTVKDLVEPLTGELAAW